MTAGSITQAPVISLNLADMLEGPSRGCTGQPSNNPSLFVTHTPRCLFPTGCDVFSPSSSPLMWLMVVRVELAD